LNETNKNNRAVSFSMAARRRFEKMRRPTTHKTARRSKASIGKNVTFLEGAHQGKRGRVVGIKKGKVVIEISKGDKTRLIEMKIKDFKSMFDK